MNNMNGIPHPKERRAHKVKEIISDLMILGGIGVLAYAGFLIHPVIGLAVIGIGLLVIGIALGKETE